MLSCFPQLTSSEFEDGCNRILEKFHRRHHAQMDWTSAETVEQYETRYLRVTKGLTQEGCDLGNSTSEAELDEVEEHDEEVLHQAQETKPVVNYDMILSPSYRVPVLYISISDPRHRFPPSMATLYEYLVPPQFKAQTEAVGVIGGITITDHPISNRPVFFIHPCQTAKVMEAIVGERDIRTEEYLIIWIGALGKCVGLDVPLALVHEDEEL